MPQGISTDNITDEIAAKIAAGERAIRLLKSIVADVHAMHMPLRLEEFTSTDIDPSAFFGEFTEYFDENTGLMISDEVGVRVYWSNLMILCNEADALINEDCGERLVTTA